VQKITRIVTAVAVAVSVLAATAPRAAQAAEDMEKLELMLHGVTAVYASAAMAMRAYVAGTLTKDDVQAEIKRNTKFLALLTRCGSEMERQAAPDDDEAISFAKDFEQVCSYLDFAFGSLSTYVSEGNDLDAKLFDRYLAKAEAAMTRLLRGASGD
jgi:hypothetical protein